MLRYAAIRLLFSIPTLLAVSFIIFTLLDLAPNDPTAQLPLTIPPETREAIKESLGIGQPFHIRYVRWLEQLSGIEIGNSGERTRVRSWSTRSPVVDLIAARLPQTLTVVGVSYLVGILLAVPVGVFSAYRQYSVFDQVGTFVTMVGFSVPTFFTGTVLIVIFSVILGWLPSVYDTTHKVTDLDSFVCQVKQMIMPVMVLGLFNAAQLARFTRSAVLDNLNQEYVRTARAKGMTEPVVILVHVLRNSMIPVVTVIALGLPATFAGAIITEQIFRINGVGQLLIGAIESADVPTVQTVTFIFSVLIVMFNLVTDLLYGVLDPRIRYD